MHHGFHHPKLLVHNQYHYVVSPCRLPKDKMALKPNLLVLQVSSSSSLRVAHPMPHPLCTHRAATRAPQAERSKLERRESLPGPDQGGDRQAEGPGRFGDKTTVPNTSVPITSVPAHGINSVPVRSVPPVQRMLAPHRGLCVCRILI